MTTCGFCECRGVEVDQRLPVRQHAREDREVCGRRPGPEAGLPSALLSSHRVSRRSQSDSSTTGGFRVTGFRDGRRATSSTTGRMSQSDLLNHRRLSQGDLNSGRCRGRTQPLVVEGSARYACLETTSHRRANRTCRSPRLELLGELGSALPAIRPATRHGRKRARCKRRIRV